LSKMGPEQFRLHAELEERHWWFVGRRTIACEIVERILPPGRGRTVVDVGCGTGANIASLADRYEAVGIDPSAAAISYARERYPDVTFLCGSAPNGLGSIAADADLFLLMDVLEHVPDDRQLLGDLVGVSKPGSHILLTVPADMSLWSEHDVAFGHYRRYDLPLLREVWNGLPVTPRLVSYFNARLFPAVKAVRTVSRWRGGASGRSGTDLSSPPPVLNRVLSQVFAGEARRLVGCLDAVHPAGYPFGVSLVAVLRREAAQRSSATRRSGQAAYCSSPAGSASHPRSGDAA
jgi:SAM-dependent methyltransferase